MCNAKTAWGMIWMQCICDLITEKGPIKNAKLMDNVPYTETHMYLCPVQMHSIVKVYRVDIFLSEQPYLLNAPIYSWAALANILCLSNATYNSCKLYFSATITPYVSPLILRQVYKQMMDNNIVKHSYNNVSS